MTIEKESLALAAGKISGMLRVPFELEVRGAVLRGERNESVEGCVCGDVLIHHGHGEHSGRYRPVVETLCRRGWRVWTYDMRGHGISSGARGHLDRYEDLLDDLGAILGTILGEARHFLLIGHSLGGQVVLSAVREWAMGRVLKGAESAASRCRGVVSASPYLRLAFSPSRARVWLARIAGCVAPKLTQKSPVHDSDLSRDVAYLRGLPGGELNHQRISARMFLEVEAAGCRLLEGGWLSEQAILLVHGGADRVTSVEATRRFWSRIRGGGGSEMRVYGEMRHELWNDWGREVVLDEMVRWMRERVRSI